MNITKRRKINFHPQIFNDFFILYLQKTFFLIQIYHLPSQTLFSQFIVDFFLANVIVAD